jgi:hypothetical protein
LIAEQKNFFLGLYNGVVVGFTAMEKLMTKQQRWYHKRPRWKTEDHGEDHGSDHGVTTVVTTV